jgi:hypothetical protein
MYKYSIKKISTNDEQEEKKLFGTCCQRAASVSCLTEDGRERAKEIDMCRGVDVVDTILQMIFFPVLSDAKFYGKGKKKYCSPVKDTEEKKTSLWDSGEVIDNEGDTV